MDEMNVPIAFVAGVEPTHGVAVYTSPDIVTAAHSLTPDELKQWLANATPGDRITYFRGFLAMDRGACSRLGKETGEELDRVAAALMTMAEAGRLHLVQRRNGPNDYTYIAVRARGGRQHGSDRPIREIAP
jgi:hypothetical protein